jgi:DNA repair protein RadC
MPKRPERIYQASFDEHFRFVPPTEVTPSKLAQLQFRLDERVSQRVKDGERFVREVQEKVYVKSPADAAHYLLTNVYAPFDQFSQEEMWVLLLNSRTRITHEVMVYRGTVNSALVRVPEIFKEAIKVNAPGLILSHCHPSADPEPSPEDAMITRQARLAAELLDIDLLDHIVVGKDAWVSLRARGLGFDPLE